MSSFIKTMTTQTLVNNPRVRSNAQRRKQLTPYLYLLPTILPLLLLTLYPFLRVIGLSFTGYDLYKRDSSFIGLSNFTQLLTQDNLFWLALRNNVIWTFGIVTATYILGLLTALALNENFPLRTFFRGITLVPWVCPGVVAALIWNLIYDPNFSFLSYGLQQLGITERRIGFLSDKNTALYAAMVMAIWKFLPFMIVMLLAGLQAIPGELYEAAAIDGADLGQKFRHITLPLLNRVGSVALLLSVISAFNHFDSLFVLTGGGPGNRTMLLSLMTYQSAFRYFQIGYSSALGILMMLILLVPLTLYMRRVLLDV